MGASAIGSAASAIPPSDARTRPATRIERITVGTFSQSTAMCTRWRMMGRQLRGVGIMRSGAMRTLPPAKITLGLLVALLPRAGAAPAATIVVPDDRPPIREAVAHAGPADAIRIKPGTYAESI